VRSEPVQYADFAGWQESLRDEDPAREAAGFWRARVEAARAIEPLPLEQPAPDGSFVLAQATARLDREAASALEAAAGSRGAGTAEFLAACWHALLWRFDQPPRVAVGHVFDGRPLDELEGAVGPYAHPLPVASAIEPGLPFGRLLEQLVASIEEAHSRQQYYGIGAAAEDAEFALPWQFEWLRPSAPGRWDGVALEAVHELTVGEPHTVKLSARPDADGIEITLSHDRGRLPEEEAARVLEALLECARAAAQRPATPVEELPLMPAPARRELLTAREELSPGEPDAATLVEALESQAQRIPDGVAVEFGEHRVTYAELVAAGRAVAATLAQHGVGPDVRVGICLERSAAYVTAIVGTLLAGGCYVPLDPDYPSRYAARILSDAEAAVLITQPSMDERFAQAGVPLVLLDPADGVPEPGAEGGFELPDVGPDDLAYAIYTSGSTGDPKGVMISHGSAISLARALGRSIYAGEEGSLRVSVNAPFTFDASVKQIVQLTRGHTLHVLPTDIRLDAHELSDHLEHHRVDVLDCTPSQLRPLLNAIEIHEQRSYPRIVLVGGEPVGEELWAALRGDELIETYNVYGPTEATVDATFAPVRRSDQTPTIGRPLPGVQALVLDAALQPVPAGVLGELCLGGWGLSRGYIGAPELTAESFVAHPEIAGERLFRTGDLARLNPDGTIDYVGRRDRQVKIRGFRIGLAEIEAAIARHDGVREVAVVDVKTSAGTKRLVAFVVASRDDDALIDSLRAHAEAELPEHMRPASYEPLDALPVTSHGKVDLARLREQAAERMEAGRTYDPPRTDTEKALADIWAKALEADRVGVNDDFFDLGGDSILQILVVARAKEQGLEITPRDLFEHPTVAELAGVCDAATPARPH
jgi:amino acid adenylation domain-containing protein